MRAGFWEILLIVVLVLILFGHSKIPDLAKNIAAGINVFKKELKNKDDKSEKSTDKDAAVLPKQTVKPMAPKSASRKASTAKRTSVAKKSKK